MCWGKAGIVLREQNLHVRRTRPRKAAKPWTDFFPSLAVKRARRERNGGRIVKQKEPGLDNFEDPWPLQMMLKMLKLRHCSRTRRSHQASYSFEEMNSADNHVSLREDPSLTKAPDPAKPACSLGRP